MSIINIVLVIAVITTGLIAGLLYAYSCSVNPGLKRLPDAGYIAAMQSINSAIQNPVFMISFLGTLILLPVSVYLHYGKIISTGFLLLLAATLIYVIGTFGVTIFGNIPLNNALDQVDLKTASIEQISHARIAFEGQWNKLHTIRTIASITGFVLAVIACLKTTK